MSGDGDAGRPGDLTQAIVQPAVVLGGLLGLMWVLEAIDTVADHRLDRYGIRPHTLVGLRGVAFAPFLHAGFSHLLANTVPFAFMGLLVFLGGVRRFVAVSVITAVVGGLGVWLFGRSNSIHFGASGIVFGYLGYLLSRGLFERKLGQVAMGLFVLLVYGGLLWGVLPNQRGISWQGHLFGFLGGVLTAYLLAVAARADKTAGHA